MKALHRSLLVIGILLTALAPAAAAPVPAGKSPINIINGSLQYVPNLPELNFTYGAVDAKVKDRGGSHTGADVMVRDPNAPNVAFPYPATKLAHDGKDYKFYAFHFHRAAEHKLNGVGDDMELHLVHKNVNDVDDILVVGRWMKKAGGNPTPSLDDVFNGLPAGAAPGPAFAEFNIDGFDLNTLLPPVATRQQHYRYSGSLTASTDKGIAVEWRFLADPLLISNGQHDKFQDYLSRRELPGSSNAEPTEPLGGRIVQTNVPEPGAALLLALAGLMAVRRTRRRGN